MERPSDILVRDAHTLSQDDVGSLVNARGRVQRFHGPELRLTRGTFRCRACATDQIVETPLGCQEIRLPEGCVGCLKPAPRAKFDLRQERLDFRMVQTFDLWSGTGRQRVQVVLSGDLLHEQVPAGPVVVSGRVVERRTASLTEDGLLDPAPLAILADRIEPMSLV
jgi:DNA replicative helicase MCM subunit Mcm2 (Cdc46/Mcm family)